MAEGEAEWELCKENIQPLRRGRAISALHQALSQQDGAGYAAIQQQKQAFESELRLYSGDDPLDVWDRYIKWTQQTYPQGGKESNLSVLLERAVKRFVDETQYHNDSRYVNLWIKFAESSTEPLDMYNYMHGQGIGVQQAALYIAWSEELETHGDSKKADSVYQEGFKCGAEPADKLHQYHKAFQARVSRQVMKDMLDGGEQEPDSPEPAQPQRSSLVDLKPRGKKTAIAPIVRTGAAVSHRSRGLNLQLPTAPHNGHNSRFLVFDEKQASAAAAAEPSEPRPERWMAPPSSRAKENEMMPEKWTDVKMPQKSRAGHSVVAPPSKPNFQPYVEECDQPPVVTPHKINPTVNTVLSVRKPSKEETPLERLQEPQQAEGDKKEQSMYCKELLFSGVTEFCFEELRAERYYKRAAQELEEKEKKLKEVKEDLKRQIEEKRNVLQDRCPQAGAGQQGRLEAGESSQPVDCLPGCAVSRRQGSDPGFKIYEECEASSSARVNQPVENEDPRLADKGSALVLPFTIFDESTTGEKTQEVTSKAVGCRPSVCRPLTAVLKPLAEAPATRLESDGLEGIESLTDDAIVSSYKNKTLCPSPDDTCDFARAAHLASTPFGGSGSGLGASASSADGLPDLSTFSVDPVVSAPTPAVQQADYEVVLRGERLSPIEEASLEDGHYSVSSAFSGSSLGGMSGMKAMHSSSGMEACPPQFPSIPEETAQNVEKDNPCSMSSRRRVLSKVDLDSFPNFYRNVRSLPEVMEDDALFIGEESIMILSQIVSGENGVVHFGQTKSRESVVVKVDFETVPWDFYVAAQLRSRLGPKSQKYFGYRSSCFFYMDGCITLSWGRCLSPLQDFLERSPFLQVAVSLTKQLLEMMEQMHSCRLVHGNIRPDTVLLRCRESGGDADSVLQMLDFSSCVDLDQQPEVMSAGDLPSAQAFIRQGLLSTSSSPYQVDLIGIAETVYMLVKKQTMNVVREDSEWKPTDDFTGTLHGHVWQEFFQKILNPGNQSTVSILSDLQHLVERIFLCGTENNLMITEYF
ncbi:mitotic checkpoint serine/threonine-protein kinase BUB1 beta [Paramormyrops kingsleyae]|uniref:BUB1 mitotic checkpoint serine/threonine kinase B n=1 Tax=Paramormyrops kingsleyae TaxID=1676925 RepID=A0A3B3RK72_9TELE|nr:mitotic checkpoint serine/threonine-protein kinase BUB1 beta [Paramormyrops kingsleyae]